VSTETTTKRYRGDLVCYNDTDEAEAVCGKCGRPVCGPFMNASIMGLIRSVFRDYGHGNRFYDSTFHHYESGLKRVLLVISLLGISVLFSVIAPGLIPRIVSATISVPIGLKGAIIQSSAIVGVALLLTLRYQRGERKTSFRIRVRQGTTRVLCDNCFDDSLVQLALWYVTTAPAIVLIILGLSNAITAGSALPLRMIALGVGIITIRSDLVGYVMAALESDTRGSKPGTTPEAGTTGDHLREREIESEDD
jgi:hypothetical protein